jgi:hypothetical protein
MGNLLMQIEPVHNLAVWFSTSETECLRKSHQALQTSATPLNDVRLSGGRRTPERLNDGIYASKAEGFVGERRRER